MSGAASPDPTKPRGGTPDERVSYVRAVQALDRHALLDLWDAIPEGDRDP